MKNSDVGDADMPVALSSARVAYRAMARALEFAISELQSGKPADRELMTTLRQHVAALQKVLEIEGELEKRADQIRRPHTGSELDLRDARDEIRRRIALLASSG